MIYIMETLFLNRLRDLLDIPRHFGLKLTHYQVEKVESYCI